MKNTKQIIVLRKFPNLRTGKYASQAAHASMAFLTRNLEYSGNYNSIRDVRINPDHHKAVDHWLSNSFRKIVCYVETEEELRELHQKALDKGLMSYLIEDNGATEFGGVKTVTALAIGPQWDEDFIGVTDRLKLF